MDAGSNSFKSQQVAQTELLPGESLLWSGQPSPRIWLHRTDWAAIPFSLLWGGFAIFWEIGASRGASHGHNQTSVFMTLWGIPFVLIGQYIIWGRFFFEAWSKTRTFYALTTQRVIVIRKGMSRNIIEGSLKTLPSMQLDELSSGFGTIDFAPEAARSFGKSGTGIAIGANLGRLAFCDIPAVREVYAIARSTRASLTGE